jgi:hypothetical protein
MGGYAVVTLTWREKGFAVPKPRRWDPEKPLAEQGGMYMDGTRETLYHAGMRPESPMITPDARFMEIKGEGPLPGSSFDYAGPLTEMALPEADRFNSDSAGRRQNRQVATIFVTHQNSAMGSRNVTVVLEEQVALWARVEAARRDTSVSRLLGDLLKQQMSRDMGYEQAMRSALQREPFLATDGRYLSRDELHERPRLR